MAQIETDRHQLGVDLEHMEHSVQNVMLGNNFTQALKGNLYLFFYLCSTGVEVNGTEGV